MVDATPQTAALLDAASLHPRFRAAADRCDRIETLQQDVEQRLRDEFVPANRPALLPAVLMDWPPLHRWQDDTYLREAAPLASVSARRVASNGVCAQGGSYETDKVSWPEIIDSLAAAAAKGDVAAPHYAAQVRLKLDLPTLLADTRPVPECVRCLGPLWRNAPAAYFGCGARTPLHFDLLENILCVVSGRKWVTLWHPADAEVLYPSADAEGGIFSAADVYDPDLERFPKLREALEERALRVELSAGDALCASRQSRPIRPPRPHSPLSTPPSTAPCSGINDLSSFPGRRLTHALLYLL
jgi:hypothetical protein